MAGADTTSDVLGAAGFGEITFRRSDLPIRIGHDLNEAVEFNLALGPAAEVVRRSGDEAAKIRPKLEALLQEALAEFETADGVIAGSSTWIVTARAAN
jgi:hypothetical protein